ncbi:MAG TPA: DinB family protein [Gemmatimonadaceae bacterium]|jgi:DinB family protein|nr:DinB family protein [Gemmatimonadaceae bacterium]
MHPRLSELLTYVGRETSALREVYESVPPDDRNVRPDPTRWSPAEIVHHLAIVDQRIVQLLGRLIEQARALPPETETAPLLPSPVVSRVLDRSRRFRTSQASEPLQTDRERVWDELLATRRALADVVATGDGLALGSVSAPHPALGTFNGYDWITFVGAHAARHADQILEMRRAH